MTGTRTLKIEVLWDGSKGEKGLANLSAQAAKTESGFTRVGGKLTDLGGKFTKFATLPIAAGFAAAINAASDLNEAANISTVVFPKASGKIDEFAKTSAKNLGQSERAAREATAQFGGLLQNLGYTEEASASASIQLTRLSSDLGSAFNKEPAEAVLAIGAAIRGETEPIRAFNVSLDDASVRAKAVEMGLASTTAEVDKHAKAQATMALILEQTAKVQGDFANTSEGLANQTRIAKAELEDTAAKIGADLLPVALDAAQGVRGLVSAFADLDPNVQKAALGGAAFVAAIGPGFTVVGNLSKAIGALKLAFDKLGLAGSGAVVLATVALGAFVKAQIEARTAAAQFVDELLEPHDLSTIAGIRSALKEVDDQLDPAIDQLRDYGNGLGFVTEGGRSWGRAIRKVVEDITPLSNKVSESSERVGELTKRTEELRAQYVHMTEAANAVAAATGLTTEEVETLARKSGIDLAGGFTKTVNSLIAAWTAMNQNTPVTEKLAKAQETLGAKVKTASEELDAFKEALDAALGVTLDADEAALRYQEKIAALSETVKENGAQFGYNTEKQRNVASAVFDTIRAAEAEVVAFVESGRVSADAAAQKQALIDRLNNLKRTFPQLAGPIDGYIAKIGSIPTKATTQIQLTGAATAAEELRRLNTQIADLRGAKLSVRVDNQARRGGALPMAHGGVIPPRPGGTHVLAAEVGQPEAFVPLPDGRSIPVRVEGRGVRADAAVGASGGPTIVPQITVNVTTRVDAAPGVDKRELAELLAAVFRADHPNLMRQLRDAVERSTGKFGRLPPSIIQGG